MHDLYSFVLRKKSLRTKGNEWKLPLHFLTGSFVIRVRGVNSCGAMSFAAFRQPTQLSNLTTFKFPCLSPFSTMSFLYPHASSYLFKDSDFHTYVIPLNCTQKQSIMADAEQFHANTPKVSQVKIFRR